MKTALILPGLGGVFSNADEKAEKYEMDVRVEAWFDRNILPDLHTFDEDGTIDGIASWNWVLDMAEVEFGLTFDGSMDTATSHIHDQLYNVYVNLT